MEKFFRLKFSGPRPPLPLSRDFVIALYRSDKHKQIIPQLYAKSFEEDPWKEDWEDFRGFDPKGVFLAKVANDGSCVGFIISFHRPDFGYISVVAVLPEWRRRGLASGLIQMAVDFLFAQKKCTVVIDVEQNNEAAIKAYQRCGAKIVDSLL